MSEERLLGSPVELHLGLAVLAAVLVGAGFVALVRSYRVVAADLGDWNEAARRWLLGVVLLAAVIRWVVAPKWMATVFVGYLWTQQAIDLVPIPHYGVGAAAFAHGLFALLPQDHVTLMWVNSIVGVLTLPLYAVFVARVFGDRWVGLGAAALVAVLPMFVRNDNSDANNVVILWWVFGGLVCFAEFLGRGRTRDLVAAAALSTLAAISRPEIGFVVLAFLLATAFALGARARLREKRVWGVGALALVAVAPHVAFIWNAARTLAGRQSLPGIRQLPDPRNNALFEPTIYPAVLVLLAGYACAVTWKSDRRPHAAVAVAMLVALLAYLPDTDDANMARIHVPAALFATALAASGAKLAWGRARRWARGVLVVAGVGSIVPTGWWLFSPTNALHEEAFIREAVNALPDEPLTLVRLTQPDPNRGRDNGAPTHLHFPGYLVANARHRAITEFRAKPDFRRPAFFFAGMRCYAQFRPDGAPAPHGDNQDPLCESMRRDFRLEPVLERTVQNRGDHALAYWGTSKNLRLGLYRVRSRGGGGRVTPASGGGRLRP